MSQLNNYYEYLKGAGADVAPNVESFKKTLDDLGVARQYFGYLKDNNFDTPETFESFTKTLGLGKKKMVPQTLSPHPSVLHHQHHNQYRAIRFLNS